MSKFVSVGLLACFLFCGIAFSAEEELIPGEQISHLYQQNKHIQVSVVWRRPDGKSEAVSDFYAKNDARPITKAELAQNCHVKDIIEALMDSSPVNTLKVAVTARLPGASWGINAFS